MRLFVTLTIVALAGGCAGVFGTRPPPTILDKLDLERLKFNQELSTGNHQQLDLVIQRVAHLATGSSTEILKILETGTNEERVIAAFGVGFIRNKAAFAAINKWIPQENNPYIKAHLISSLGVCVYIKTAEINEIDLANIKTLLLDSDGRIRQATLFACWLSLQEGNDKGLLDTIHLLLRDSSPTVRNEAVVALTRINNQKSFDELIKTTLNDRESLIRTNTAIAIKKIGRHKSIEYLVKLLRDQEHQVVSIAHASLVELTNIDLGSSYVFWKQFYDEGKLAPQFCCPDHPNFTSYSIGKCGVCSKDLKQLQQYYCHTHLEFTSDAPGKCKHCEGELKKRQ